MKCSRCKLNKQECEFNGCKWCNLCREKAAKYRLKHLDDMKNITINQDEKRCNRCKVIKYKNEFNKYQDKCSICQSYCDSYYENNKEQEIKRALKSQKAQGRERINDYKKNLIRRNPINYILTRTRCRAKKLGLPFNITHEDIVIPKRCPIFGYELKISEGQQADCSPSIDRIIPELGYVKGNIQIISWRANDLKKNATIDELKKLVSYLEEIHCSI
jgi:hypothetical protein